MRPSSIAQDAHAGVSPTLLVIRSRIAILVMLGNDNPAMRVPHLAAPSSSTFVFEPFPAERVKPVIDLCVLVAFP